MATAIPIFRIFDYELALKHYCDWLGFKVDWEHKPENSPKYVQVSFRGIVLHLTEHYGDCTPGSRVHVEGFENIEEYHQQLITQNNPYSRPGLERAFYDDNTWVLTTGDPFGNRLTITGPVN